MAAQLICNQWVAGSTPVTSSKKCRSFVMLSHMNGIFFCENTVKNRNKLTNKLTKSVFHFPHLL